MLLGFSTQYPDGTNNYFPNKIMACFNRNYIIQGYKPKLHTVRKDETGRWNNRKTIHFATGIRTKNCDVFFQEKCTGVQRIIIIPDEKIIIDGRELSEQEKKDFAVNDGFDNLEQFFSWFTEHFKGKLIHWTDKRY